jgi:hypothetical protein
MLEKYYLDEKAMHYSVPKVIPFFRSEDSKKMSLDADDIPGKTKIKEHLVVKNGEHLGFYIESKIDPAKIKGLPALLRAKKPSAAKGKKRV